MHWLLVESPVLHTNVILREEVSIDPCFCVHKCHLAVCVGRRGVGTGLRDGECSALEFISSCRSIKAHVYPLLRYSGRRIYSV